MTLNLLPKLAAWVLAVVMLYFSPAVIAGELFQVDDLLRQTEKYLENAPEKATAVLEQLKERQSLFTKKQTERYYLLRASSLGYSGKHSERIELIQTILEKNLDPNTEAKFLYELSDSFIALGDYEKALDVMNQSIILLPKVTNVSAKSQTLHAAITLLNSLHAYSESSIYAERMFSIATSEKNLVCMCMAVVDRIEIKFLNGDHEQARLLMPEGLRICNASGLANITLSLKSFSAIDMINSGDFLKGLTIGIHLLNEFSKINENSESMFQLENAIARAYLKIGDLKRAEQYGISAHLHAKSRNIVQLMEKTSETMAAIKRAQGQLSAALEYYDINLALKKKVLDDQLQKNLAYQRVKFDTQDKANQLALSEQRNKILNVEKALQQGKNQNLLLWLTLGLILLVILGAWLVRTLQQKNIFRTSSQIDGLTQVSNRGHFMDCSVLAFSNPDNLASVLLFDMDHFKKINDTFGHAVGDWVLKTVCATVKLQLRKTDVLGRLGGEEFGICQHSSTEEQVFNLAERCRAAVAAIDTEACGFRFPISASFGVATRGKRELRSFEETLAAADKALYFSKNEGRNRVSAYQ